jgi:hypothetical protein
MMHIGDVLVEMDCLVAARPDYTLIIVREKRFSQKPVASAPETDEVAVVRSAIQFHGGVS